LQLGHHTHQRFLNPIICDHDVMTRPETHRLKQRKGAYSPRNTAQKGELLTTCLSRLPFEPFHIELKGLCALLIISASMRTAFALRRCATKPGAFLINNL